LSPDRKHEGLDLAKSSNDNLGVNPMMARLGEKLQGFVNWRSIKQKTDAISETVKLQEDYRPKLVSQLSGGNQQKVLFGKAFGQDIDLFIFDEPTVGVDMGTRAALYLLIKDLAEAGKAVVIISSDLPEVLNLSHRILVLAHGQITAELSGDDMSEDQVLKYFFDETGATA
jgi:ribose transport system ATP-binding protein